MRFFRDLILTLLGFSLALLLRSAVIPPLPGPVETSTAPLLASRRECTVLFIGPSYVAMQIKPDVFDREARKIGFDAKACAYGTHGLKGYELRLLLDRLLSYDWPRLKIVVIDITLGDAVGYNPANGFKPRVIEWHTWSAVPWLFDYYRRRDPRPPLEKATLFVTHLEHVAAHYAALGQGPEMLAKLRLVERIAPPAPRESSHAGEEDVTEAPAKKNRRGAAYQRQVADLMETKRKRRPGRSEWPLELREVVRAHRVEAYFLIAPVLYKPKTPDRAFQGEDRLVVLDFNDPEHYPELYAEEVRGKTSHLRGEGAVIYSELLARKLRRLERRPR